MVGIDLVNNIDCPGPGRPGVRGGKRCPILRPTRAVHLSPADPSLGPGLPVSKPVSSLLPGARNLLLAGHGREKCCVNWSGDEPWAEGGDGRFWDVFESEGPMVQPGGEGPGPG